uniref:Uncharacterized protein n=1 Tax=Rhizophora mucronata TaxID=61149 RepID=A0A2P2N8Y1_RHIMU
MEMLSLAPVS